MTHVTITGINHRRKRAELAASFADWSLIGGLRHWRCRLRRSVAMTESTDDTWDAAEHDEETRDCLRQSCDCDGWHWFQNDDGLYECAECRLVVDV